MVGFCEVRSLVFWGGRFAVGGRNDRETREHD
jgi:hypothetical protein